jgi:glycosyltransferase involved in cell wall biosynthesis
MGVVAVSGDPSASVIVPVYNGAETIAGTLTSLRAQVGAPATEIIVVDNGSTDATVDVVRRFPVRLLHEGRRGPAAARNRGLEDARGTIVLHCDADCVVTRRWVADLIAALEGDPNAMIVAGRNECFWPSSGAERYAARSGIFDAEQAVRRPAFPFAPSLNMAVRREAALAVGGWDERFSTAEDVDFSHRLLQRFGPSALTYQPAAVVFHRTRATDEALKRQAWSYGEGVAFLYRRYPEELPWDLRRTLLVAGRAAVFLVRPEVLALGKALGVVPHGEVEFSSYARLWNWWFWRGFFARLHAATPF